MKNFMAKVIDEIPTRLFTKCEKSFIITALMNLTSFVNMTGVDPSK